LAVSPGLVFFDYGKGREGYWDALCFHNQTEDVLDCLEVLHPGWQPVLLCDWSSGHNGMGEGGLTTGTISGEGKMNLSYGGRRRSARDDAYARRPGAESAGASAYCHHHRGHDCGEASR
jgi:hypothetical protein